MLEEGRARVWARSAMTARLARPSSGGWATLILRAVGGLPRVPAMWVRLGFGTTLTARVRKLPFSVSMGPAGLEMVSSWAVPSTDANDFRVYPAGIARWRR